MNEVVSHYAKLVEDCMNALPWAQSRSPMFKVEAQETGKPFWPYELVLLTWQAKPRRKNARGPYEYMYGHWETPDSSVAIAFKNVVHNVFYANVRVNRETWMRVSPVKDKVMLYIPVMLD